MWTKISNGTENGYYMKYHHKDDGYVFFLTDFIRIWKSSCDKPFLEKLLTVNMHIFHINIQSYPIFLCFSQKYSPKRPFLPTLI